MKSTKETTVPGKGGGPPSAARRGALFAFAAFGAAGVGYAIFFVDWGALWEGARDAFSSVEALREFVLGFGPWAPVVFFLAQAAQVVLVPIPGGATVVAGALLFGPWWGTALSLAGGVVGSAALFLLVRRWGRPLAKKIVGRGAYDKYAGALDEKGLWLFAVMLVPFAPDDVVVALAGLSAVTFRRFVVLVAAGRLPSWAATAFVTADLVGRPAATLAMAGLVLVALAGVVFLYRERLEAWLLRLAAGERQR